MILRTLTLLTTAVFVKCIWLLKARLAMKNVAIKKSLKKCCLKHLIPEKKVLCSLSRGYYQRHLIKSQGFTTICACEVLR